MADLYDGKIVTAEVEIDTILPEREVLILTQGKHTAMNVAVDDVDPDSALGEEIRQLSDYDYVTATFEFDCPEPDMIGCWRIKEIKEMRESKGAERNVFSQE